MEQVQQRTTKMTTGLENLPCEKRVGELVSTSPEKRWLLGGPNSSLSVSNRRPSRQQSQAVPSGVYKEDERQC